MLFQKAAVQGFIFPFIYHSFLLKHLISQIQIKESLFSPLSAAKCRRIENITFFMVMVNEEKADDKAKIKYMTDLSQILRTNIQINVC